MAYSTETLRPTGRGLNNQLGSYPAAPAWGTVDEVVTDEDVSYLYLNSELGTQQGMDSFTHNWDITPGGIYSLTIYIRCRKANVTVTTGECCTYLRQGSGDNLIEYGSTETLTTSYQNFSTVYATSPFTGDAWTSDEIDDVQLGVKLVTDSSVVSPPSPTPGAVRCTQVWAVVEYLPRVRKLVLTEGTKLTIPEGTKMSLGEF